MGRLSEPSSSILVAAATPAPAAVMTEQMTLRGTLKGHNGWVTQIATTPQFPDMILSASRGTAEVPGRGWRGRGRCARRMTAPVGREVGRELTRA